MDLLGFPELSTFLALGDRTALLLDLKKRSIVVMTGGRAVAFDAGFTCGRILQIRAGVNVGF